MPTKRSYGDSVVYRIKRQVPGIGKVNRSLGTGKKSVARKLESAILTAAEQGYLDLVRAFIEGDVSAARVREARDRGTLSELQQEVRRDVPALSQAIDRALADKKPDVAESTLSNYRSSLDQLEELVEEDPDVSEVLSRDRIQQFKRHRLEEVAKTTVGKDLKAVSVLCTYAERKGWIEERPEIEYYDTDRGGEPNYLEPREVWLYLMELRPAFRPLMETLILSGMRIGEALDLRVSDLRLEKNELVVRESKTDEGRGRRFLPDRLVETLRDHLDRTDRTGADLVFQIPGRTVRGEHARARDRIGRPELRAHDLRHTFAVLMAKSGTPMHLLQDQLGHAQIEVTREIYASYHPDWQDVSEYYGRLEERLEPDAAGESEEQDELVAAIKGEPRREE